jgi:hypothetical protein
MMSNVIVVPGDAVEVTCGRLQGCCFLLVHLSHFYMRLQNDAGFLFVAAPGTVQKMTPVPKEGLVVRGVATTTTTTAINQHW